MNRIKDILKAKNIKLTELSEEMGLKYPSFYRMINKPTLNFLEQLEKHTGINIIEFQEAPDGFAHFYDDKTGEWLVIRKK